MSYITIEDFMVKDLKLKGNDLLVYAIIYGFSQDGESSFTGSISYLCEWTGSTRQGITKNLNSLIEKGLIVKEKRKTNGVNYVAYYATEFTEEQLSLHNIPNIPSNNISSNKDKELEDKEEGFLGSIVTETKPKKKNKWEKCYYLITEFTEDTRLRELLNSYLRLRLEMTDSPMYVNQWKGMLNKLGEFSDDVDVLCDIVQQSIDRGYRGFFEVKDYRKKGFTEAISKSTPAKDKKLEEGSNISGRKF